MSDVGWLGDRSAATLLGPGGPIAAALSGYEARDGQQRVAAAVAELLRNDGVLLCEAGTGIGKTFAYLVPALLSGRKVVISTATRTLQDQIAGRDLPAALSALGMTTEFSVMKGLGNYLCRRRHREFQLSQEAHRPTYADPLRFIQRWMTETETGDLAELASVPEGFPLRGAIASSSDTRRGQACPHFSDCFVTRMKQEAERAQIVVVNHHLFFADLALRGPHPGRVLPDYDCVIFDEAHQIEDTAALFFGIRLTSSQISRLCQESARLLAGSGRLASDVDRAFAELGRSLGLPRGGTRALLRPGTFDGQPDGPSSIFSARLEELGQALTGYASQERDSERREALEHLARRAEQQREAFQELGRADPSRVTWMENLGGNLTISSTPVDLSEILRTRLFEEVPAVGLLSATLRASNASGSKGFAYVRSRLGIGNLPEERQLSVPSPFDYETNCLLYLPRDLPPPSSPEFLDQAAARIAELVDVSDGGAFVLTTSLSSMRSLADKLSRLRPERRIWVQGERPKDVLLSAFRAEERGVLVATSSFWEGVDVPGHSLRMLILEKIPFSVPSDPIFEARSQALEAAGQNAFMTLAVPEAAIRLKQGFGRLIRRQTDRGAVAILDDRIHRRGYGKRLLAALPPARRALGLDELEAFFAASVNSGEKPFSG